MQAILATIFFAAAVLHLFFCDRFQKKAGSWEGKGPQHAIYDFLGNSTLIFGLWLIPTLISILILQGPTPVVTLLGSINYTEPFAYFVLITLATVRPLLQLFEAMIDQISKAFHENVSLWWATVLIFSALLTGCFSEIAIMTLAVQYLSTRFFSQKPSTSLTYFTFSSLLLAIAVGGVIIPINFSFFFSALDSTLSHWQIFHLFGWKTLVAILIVLALGLMLFRKEFTRIQKPTINTKKHKLSFRHYFYGLLFLIASFGKQNPYVLMMVIALVVILHKAGYKKKGAEKTLHLYFPLLIAFFTTTLEIQAQLQKWWVEPLLTNLKGFSSFALPYLLTGLNEHVPLEALRNMNLVSFLSYLGVLAGGALTFIAKSSNIVAKKWLKSHFPHRVISPFIHLLYALCITLTFSLIVYLLRGL